MKAEETLKSAAAAIIADRKGILAIDETASTCTRRFAEFGIQSTEDNRRSYREMLVTTPGIGEYVSAAILFDETIRQKTSDGRTFVEALKDAGIIPGIKVDLGATALAKAPGETVTEGLDGLRQRLLEYSKIGARFTKWRAVIQIGPGLPSRYCIQTNAHALGSYGALAQEAGWVPSVERGGFLVGVKAMGGCQEGREEGLTGVLVGWGVRGGFFEGK